MGWLRPTDALFTPIGLGVLPDAATLASGSVQTFDKPANEAGQTAAALMGDLEKLGAGGGLQGSAQPARAQISIGPGLTSLPARLVEDIQANKYIDFADLPPAKGRSRQPTPMLEGQVVLVQAADLMQSRRVIPDLATWTQCFGLYMAVITKSQPDRVPELLAYQSLVARASQKYKWPAWVVYDQNFRSEMAGKTDQSWANVDPGINAQ